MIVTCTCNNCSNRLEFDSPNAGTTIVCPSCKLETQLYISQATPRPEFKKVLRPLTEYVEGATTRELLGSVRADSCYKTLRSLIDVLQILAFVLAGLIALGGVGASLVSFFAPEKDMILPGLFICLSAVISSASVVVLAIAGKQALVVVLDIADCQIQARQHKS